MKKHSALTQPKRSPLAARKGGNTIKSTPYRDPGPMVKRRFNLRDYHGKVMKK